MSKNNVATNLFTVDFVSKKIYGSKKALAEAGKGEGDAYKELLKKMKANPNFVVEVKKQQSHLNGRAKITYKGLNEDFMVAYFKTKEDAPKYQAEFERVKANAKNSRKRGCVGYASPKTWFISTFGENDADGKVDKAGNPIKHFDMAKARAEIKASSLDEITKAKVLSFADASSMEAEAQPSAGD